MKIWRKYWVCICSAFLVFGLTGCLGGSKPDIVSEDKKDGQAYSSDEVRTMVVDRPFMLSGSYFLKRDYPQQQAEAEKSPDPASQGLSSAENLSSEKDLSGTGAKKDSRLSGNRKIGLLINAENEDSLSARRLAQAAEGVVVPEGSLIGPQQLAEAVSPADCRRSKDFLSCMGQQAALYPGVHMIVEAGPLNLPESFPGRAVLQFRVMDTGLGHVYSPLEIVRTIQSPDEARPFVRQATEGALDFAVHKADVMPAYCRVFSAKNNRIYINAGTSGDIAVGDEFDVTASGHVVDTPAGMPVAWVPDAPRARIRVEEIVRDNVSSCSLVKGSDPRPGDYVLIPMGR